MILHGEHDRYPSQSLQKNNARACLKSKSKWPILVLSKTLSASSMRIPKSLLFTVLLASCTINESSDPAPSRIPEVETTGVTDIRISTAKVGGQIVDDHGFLIEEKGVCWDSVGEPTYENSSRTNDGLGAAPFSSTITGLEQGKTYFVRAFAKNEKGIGYGNIHAFTTATGVVDVDGNIYKTVEIGNQVWMAENLRTTRFDNGILIPEIGSSNEWVNNGDLGIPARTKYNNSDANSEVFGLLYNYHSVISQNNLCPSGWHVPTKNEYELLFSNFSTGTEGRELKASGGLPNWIQTNTGTNSSGFSIIGNGYRSGFSGTFFGLQERGLLWTSTEEDNFDAIDIIFVAESNAATISDYTKGGGMAVRCVKD